MASFRGAFLLALLISVPFAEELQLQLSTVQRLVDYEYPFNFSQMIPGVEYSGSIAAKWAVPDSALSGLEGKTITVKITAIAQNNSSVYFAQQSRQAEAFLYCRVQNGSCSNGSALFAQIPIAAKLGAGEAQATIILLSEESYDGGMGAGIGAAAGGILESIAGAFNASQNASNSPPGQPEQAELLNFSGNGSGENFLDSLRPEGNPQDPVEFLRENPLISLAALAIVIIITGAYLLKSKD